MRLDMPILTKNIAMLAASIFVALTILGCTTEDNGADGDGDSDHNSIDAGSGGSGGDGTGNGGSGIEDGGVPTYCPDDDPPFADPNCINLKCPKIPPLQGERAPKGACCFRTSNQDIRDRSEPGDIANISFAVMGANIVTQQQTIGSEGIKDMTQAIRDAGAGQVLLLRFAGIPREEDETGPVDIEITVGGGRQNCDGTYSFYGKGAAIEWEERTDPDRWMGRTVPGVFDWEADPYVVVDEEYYTTELIWAPVWASTEVNDLFYEQPIRNIRLQVPNNDAYDEEMNCVGYIDMNGEWHGYELVSVFIPMQEADESMIGMADQTLCSVIANNVGGNQDPDDPNVTVAYTCDGPRRGGDNPWHELPDSYCTDQDCWIGDRDHPDADCEPGGEQRPCCDPVDESADMPGCNAWFVLLEVAAGAATTKETADGDIVYITRSEEASPRACP